jgi:fatty-acyl-CoA synthase
LHNVELIAMAFGPSCQEERKLIRIPPPRPQVFRTVADLLFASVEKWPDATALVFPNERLTYAEVGDRAWRFALSLSRLGIGAGDKVGLLMLNAPDFVTAFFGISISGASVVPINARYRSQELSFLIGDANLRAIVTHDRHRDYIDFAALLHEALPTLAAAENPIGLSLPGAPDLRVAIMMGESRPPGFLGRSAFEALVEEADADRLVKQCSIASLASTAAIIYTSGTTSQPRGAILSHEALVAGWSMVARRWGLDAQSRFWAPVPLFHIAAIGPLIGVFSLGGCFISASHFEPEQALEQIEMERATMLYPCYPPITQAILSHPDFASRDLSSVKAWVNVAPPETLRAMAKALPHARQLSTYGGTEGGPVTLHSPDDDADLRARTCGAPMPGVDIRIVDPDTRQELPTGQAGEITYRGYQTFGGYYGDPQKTAAVLEDGWFRTGDLGAFDENGHLCFLGRIKEMLKVGGENVAPSEVEAYLETHPGVKLAQVVGIPDERLTEVVAAFVELHDSARLTEDDIITFCRGKIASFRIPRVVRIVESWPMSSTKIKRDQLRAGLIEELEKHAHDNS